LTIEVEDLHSNKVTNAETQLRWRWKLSLKEIHSIR
jgi:hypothetical protein